MSLSLQHITWTARSSKSFSDMSNEDLLWPHPPPRDAECVQIAPRCGRDGDVEDSARSSELTRVLLCLHSVSGLVQLTVTGFPMLVLTAAALAASLQHLPELQV